MVDQHYRYGFVVARVNPSPGPEDPEILFPTIPAGCFCTHHIIVKDWELVICGVAVKTQDVPVWNAAHQAKEIRYLGDTKSEARTELKKIWSQVQGKVYVEWRNSPGTSNFKRFGMFCGCDL